MDVFKRKGRIGDRDTYTENIKEKAETKRKEKSRERKLD